MNQPIDPQLQPCAHHPNGTHNLSISILNDLRHGVLHCTQCGIQVPVTVFEMIKQASA